MSEKIVLRGHLKFDPMTAHVTLRVEPASDIVVEDSAPPKFLLLKNGEFICWKSVFLNQGQGGMCIRLRRGIGLGIWQECSGP